MPNTTNWQTTFWLERCKTSIIHCSALNDWKRSLRNQKTLQQITTTDLPSLWLINGLTPFQSDSHYYNTDQPVLRTKVVAFDFNSSLDSNDDFCSGQSLISTTDLSRTTLTSSIALHDWQRKATKRKIWQKSILLIELHSWHEIIKLKIWTLFWKRKHLCFVLHEGKSDLYSAILNPVFISLYNQLVLVLV